MRLSCQVLPVLVGTVAVPALVRSGMFSSQISLAAGSSASAGGNSVASGRLSTHA